MIGMRLIPAVCALYLTLTTGFSQTPGAPYPPTGKLVDVGGYRVHLYCTGEGSPTVLIVASFSFDWGLVQPEVAKFARVCTYDPSGTAWSDPGPGASCTDRVVELHKLLENAGISGPVVLVGYSLGAIRARIFAGEYPGSVAGMVIVDHAIDLGRLDRKQSGKAATTKGREGLDSPPELLSNTPIALGLEDDPAFARLPRKNRELHLWAAPGAAALQTNEIVTECLKQGDELLRSRPAALGELPLVVVSNPLRVPIYTDLQSDLLKLSSNSRHIIAGKSGHGVIVDEPEVVIRAIRLVVGAVRSHGTV